MMGRMEMVEHPFAEQAELAARGRAGIRAEQFWDIAETYRRRWGVELVAVDAEGRPLWGGGPCTDSDDNACRQARKNAVAEAVRWGEPTVTFCPRKLLIWAVPLMVNARVTGGLVAHAPEQKVFPASGGPVAFDVRHAAGDLRRLVEQANLTNAEFLAARRREYRREQLRAEALHQAKMTAPDIRRLYFEHEPALMAAIRRDDRPAARGLLNEILTAICFAAGGRIDLTRSFFMELVVMMSRTAIEAGAPEEKLLTMSFTQVAELSAVEDEEALAGWLHRSLEAVMDAIRTAAAPSDRAVAQALHYMSEHLAENIGRDDVAEAVGLSAGYFSRRFRAETGQSFSAVFRRMRVDRAAELLVRTDLPLTEIAFESGFSDQSYFTKVFRELTGLPPGEHRQRYRSRD